MSFAVIKTGGKQYKVSAGDTLKIEKLAGAEKDGQVTFDEVLLVDDGSTTRVGEAASGAKVTATVVEEAGRADKVVGIKYRAKSRYRVKYGHRQPFTSVKIAEIK